MLSHVYLPHTATTDDTDGNSENGSGDDNDDEPVILTVEDIPTPPNNQMTLNQTTNPMYGPTAKQQSIFNATIAVVDKKIMYLQLLVINIGKLFFSRCVI